MTKQEYKNKVVDILKDKLTKMEAFDDFDSKNPIYMALKEKVEQLDKEVLK